MKSTMIAGPFLVALVCAVPGTTWAADLSLGQWTYSFNERAQINLSAPISNNGATDSGPLLITMWATLDPRDSSTVTSGFRLIQITDDGIAAFTSREIQSGFQDHVQQPDPGTYNIAVEVLEDSASDPATVVGFSSSQLTFPLPEAPSEADIRRRVANLVPCGSLFVQFSLVTFVGLCAMKRIGPTAR